MDRKDLERRLRLSQSIAERVSSGSVRGYLGQVVIDSRPEPKRFGDIAEPWQWETFDLISPAIESVAGLRTDYKGPRSFWFTRGRGHDKTSSIGRLANWALGFSKRNLSMSVAAGDMDQAGLIVEAMQAEARLNTWLSNRIRFGKTRVKGPGGTLKILASNAATSWGLNNDLVIADELTHWPNDDLWKVLWSGREKRPGSVFIVITNAGVINSWQHEIHQKALQDPSWLVHDIPEGVQLASWMSPEAVQRMRSMLPRGLAKRVIDNRWIDPAEEADYLTRAEIQVCEALGVSMGLSYQERGVPGVRYVVGIDYGPRRDRTALVVLHFDLRTGLVVIDKLDVWQGSPESPVRVQAIEEWIRDVNQKFYNPLLVIDPYQMEGTIQKFEIGNVVETFEARAGKRTYQLAENLRSVIVNRQLAWYPGAGNLLVGSKIDTLVDEIAGLVIVPTPYGYRFDHKAGFHDDRAVAIGMAALHAARMDPSGPGAQPSPIVTPENFASYRPLGIRLRQPNPVAFERRGLWGL